jgi:hypothetical protein
MPLSTACLNDHHNWCESGCTCHCHPTSDDQPSLFGGLTPPVSRTTDPDTSHAAEAQLDKTGRQTMQRKLLAVIDKRTSEEATSVAGYSKADGAWKRVSDLRNAGLIRDSGDRRRGSSGRMQIVWEVVR